MSYEILLDKIEKNIAKHLIFYFICVIILYDDSYAEDRNPPVFRLFEYYRQKEAWKGILK